jgi:hypothetical protein
MTLSADHARLLKRVLRGRSRADTKKLFAVIRATDDHVLLATIAPARKRSKRRGDPLVRELQQTLKPILGPAAEKAEMLIEHLAKKHRRKLALEPRGLADAAKLLRTKFSDDQVRAGAKSLVAHLSKLYGDRETVV